MNYHVGRAADDAELSTFGDIVSDAFVSPRERFEHSLSLVGPENIRVVHVGGTLAGGLILLPMGQYFGGRSVPTVGIAAVAIAPTQRARGGATALLKAMLAEQRAAGMALSTLFPATRPLYRRVGYQCAAAKCDFSLPLHSIEVRERGVEVAPLAPADLEAVHALYAAEARRTPGMLDRSEVIWQRVYDCRGDKAQGYVWRHDGRLVAYAFVLLDTVGAFQWNVRLHDFAATTPAGARALLTFLADQRTVRERAVWRGGFNEPLLDHLGEAPHTISAGPSWMLRIVDVARALAARGYPEHLDAELHLHVRDDILPENEGHWRLQVHAGRGTVTPGGSSGGVLDIDVRGLAALYSGYRTARALVDAGWLTGPESALQLATEIFAGSLPWMRDNF